MLIKCTQLSIEVTLAGILAQIYGGHPLNHINADGWVPEFEKEHNSMLALISSSGPIIGTSGFPFRKHNLESIVLGPWEVHKSLIDNRYPKMTS